MTSPAEELRSAAVLLRRRAAGTGSEVDAALAELLEHIADDMDDDRAEEAPIAEGKPSAVRTGFPTANWRWDWTAALDLARLILAGGGS